MPTMLFKVLLSLLVGFMKLTATNTLGSKKYSTTTPSDNGFLNCIPPALDKDQLSWKDGSTQYNINLNNENAVCYFNRKCFANKSSEEDFIIQASNVIQFDLQEGDWLVLHFNVSTSEHIDLNDTLEVVLDPVPESEAASCNHAILPLESTTHWKVKIMDNNITLNEEILLAGIHVFSVRIPSSDCDISWTLNITVRTQECSRIPNEEICSGKGTCLSDQSLATFTCRCCPGFVGRFCEERDGCFAKPCQHGGFCVDITEGLTGSTFQCLCPHGFRGQACEEEVNLCDREPCLNNGTCKGNQTTYSCDCPPGFSGRHCDTNVNQCLSSPCVHGVCEEGISGYKCYCLPGYGGDHCEFEYDECDSSPCINGGACEDLVAGYRCHCGPGYQGRRCQIKIDLCLPNPCPPPAHCVDRGNNYSCICHPGYNGPGCTQQYDPCFPNPCQNGGSCWPSLDSFFCSCRAGYTGDTCEVLTSVSELRYPGMPMAHTLEDTSVYRSATIGPASAPLDHLHNLYIAAATLAGACLIVLGIVTICHCRVHKPYRRFSRNSSDCKQDQLPRQVFTEVVWERF